MTDNPRAWLITVASRRLTELLRADQARRRREDTVSRWVLPQDWLSQPPTDLRPSSMTRWCCCSCAAIRR